MARAKTAPHFTGPDAMDRKPMTPERSVSPPLTVAARCGRAPPRPRPDNGDRVPSVEHRSPGAPPVRAGRRFRTLWAPTLCADAILTSVRIGNARGLAVSHSAQRRDLDATMIEPRAVAMPHSFPPRGTLDSATRSPLAPASPRCDGHGRGDDRCSPNVKSTVAPKQAANPAPTELGNGRRPAPGRPDRPNPRRALPRARPADEARGKAA